MNTICFHVILKNRYKQTTVSRARLECQSYSRGMYAWHAHKNTACALTTRSRKHALACVQTRTYKIASRGEGARRAVNSLLSECGVRCNRIHKSTNSE